MSVVVVINLFSVKPGVTCLAVREGEKTALLSHIVVPFKYRIDDGTLDRCNGISYEKLSVKLSYIVIRAVFVRFSLGVGVRVSTGD